MQCQRAQKEPQLRAASLTEKGADGRVDDQQLRAGLALQPRIRLAGMPLEVSVDHQRLEVQCAFDVGRRRVCVSAIARDDRMRAPDGGDLARAQDVVPVLALAEGRLEVARTLEDEPREEHRGVDDVEAVEETRLGYPALQPRALDAQWPEVFVTHRCRSVDDRLFVGELEQHPCSGGLDDVVRVGKADVRAARGANPRVPRPGEAAVLDPDDP